ncbi:MAG: HD domain-containing phosphohydrolase, partial [Betaproteobacteria bacterium]
FMPSSASPGDEQDELARQAIGDCPLFIKAVTRLADKREVVAREDIYAKGGMKLVSGGSRLSGHHYDRLVAHKLLKPIEQSLRVAGALDASRLLSLVLEKARLIPSLVQRLEESELLVRLKGLFTELTIPEPLALKLSVMQEEHPALFEHSLMSAVIATVLGIRGKLPREEIQALTLASVFHDIGELYIDPGFFEQGHQMTMEERRHLYVHPITGFLMLRDFAELPKGTADAVLQHHERLDGVGYPYRLSGGQITTVSRYLAVAEVAASLFLKYGADKRISMKFRMNIKKYDANAVTIISSLFEDPQLQHGPKPDEVALIARLAQVGKLFEGWADLKDSLSEHDLAELSFLVERMNSLRGLVLEPGYDQCRLEDIVSLSGEADPEICMELMVLLDELNWQFKALSRGVERDQSVWGMQIPGRHKNKLDDWLAQVRCFVESERTLNS